MEKSSTEKLLFWIVTRNRDLVSRLREGVANDYSINIVVAENAFEAGQNSRNFQPRLVIVDFSIGKEEGLQICRSLRKILSYNQVPTLALLDEQIDSLLDSSIDFCIPKKSLEDPDLSAYLRSFLN